MKSKTSACRDKWLVTLHTHRTLSSIYTMAYAHIQHVPAIWPMLEILAPSCSHRASSDSRPEFEVGVSSEPCVSSESQVVSLKCGTSCKTKNVAQTAKTLRSPLTSVHDQPGEESDGLGGLSTRLQHPLLVTQSAR